MVVGYTCPATHYGGGPCSSRCIIAYPTQRTPSIRSRREWVLQKKGLVKFAGVGVAGAALSLVLAGPAFAENVHAGEFCAKKRAGQFTTGSNGVTLQCTFASGGNTPRWHTAVAQTGGAVPTQPGTSTNGGTGSGSSSTGGTAGVMPQTVSAGTAGTADSTSSPVPLAVGWAGIAMVAGSAAVLARRKP